jgi:alkylation response protein AidB-like acyl-CoA dehydrogenase
MMVFTDQQNLLRQVVMEFVEKEIAPIAGKIDAEDTCPVDLFRKMGTLGFNSVFVPQKYGGAGLGFTERAIILEEMSRYAAGFSMVSMTHDLGVGAILNFGTEAQKQKYLPELCSAQKIAGLSATEQVGGSDFMGQQATGVLEGEQWVLNGRKCFITNSHIVDVNIITARTGEDAKGRPALSAFIVESNTPGVAPGRKENKFGLRGSYMGEVILDNAKVGQEALLGKAGEGAKVGLKTVGEIGRAGMAAISCGILCACLEESVKFAKERIIYGKPLAKLSNIQFDIAENRTDYEAARLLTYHAIRLVDQGVPCTEHIAMAKLFATEAAVRAAKRTIDLMGGYGVVNEYPIGRYLRDAIATIPSGGTSHVMKLIIAGSTLA